MPSGNINYTAISFIISKFIFTVVIGVSFFMFNIKSIGEDTMTVLYNNLYKNTIPNNKETTKEELHNSAENIINFWQQEDSYEQSCTATPLLCKIINTTITDRDQKEKYNTLTLTTLQNINAILSKNYPSLEEWLISIIIKNEPWGKRWYANHHAIVINSDKIQDDEYIEVLTHELWHIIDLWIIEWSTQIKNPLFTEFDKQVFSINDISLLYYTLSRESEKIRKEEIKKEDFCTIYAMSNPFEDFAECINLYLNHNNYFNTIKKSSTILDKKYNFIAQIFNDKYIYKKLQDWLSDEISYRYRDSTKMKSN